MTLGSSPGSGIRAPSTSKTSAAAGRKKSSSSGFYRLCWLPSGVPIELVVLGKDEDVDRDALDASLSLADLFPDRVTTLTLDPTSPQRALNLRLEVGGRDDPH